LLSRIWNRIAKRFALFTDVKFKNDTEQRHLTITSFVPHMVPYEQTNLVKFFNKENISFEPENRGKH
jgi:hypothetical protein